tara:strand:+ start:1536 stop:3068 length:1533 start_codon:yes stop_codon:yes gene_type:complete
MAFEDTTQMNEANMENAAVAINAPPFLILLASMVKTWAASVGKIPKVALDSLASQYGIKKGKKKSDTVQNLLDRLSATVNSIPIFPKVITQHEAEKLAAAGAFGDKVGQVAKFAKVAGGDEATAWSRAVDYIKDSLPAATERQIELRTNALIRAFPTTWRMIQTKDTTMKHGRSVQGEYDSIMWNRWTDRPTPQASWMEWRLGCRDRSCTTPHGVRSFVRGIGYGCRVSNNPLQEKVVKSTTYNGNEYERTLKVMPEFLKLDDGSRYKIPNPDWKHEDLTTMEIAASKSCPTCGGGVEWAERLVGGYSSMNGAGGWNASSKLPALLWPNTNGYESRHPELSRVLVKPVRIEYNNNAPRFSSTCKQTEGIPPFGRYGSGEKQRHGIPAKPEGNPNKRIAFHYSGHVERQLVVIQLDNGNRITALMWVFVHDEDGQARGIHSDEINEAASLVDDIIRIADRSASRKKGSDAVALFGAVDILASNYEEEPQYSYVDENQQSGLRRFNSTRRAY